MKRIFQFIERRCERDGQVVYCAREHFEQMQVNREISRLCQRHILDCCQGLVPFLESLLANSQELFGDGSETLQ